SDVVRNASRFQPVQAQGGKTVRYQCPYGGSHIPLAGKWRTNPIPNTACLRHAATNIGNRQSTDHGVVVAAEYQKSIGQIAALIFGVSLEPPAEGTAREIVSRPDRLPGNQKAPTHFAQGCPFGKIAAVRRTQRHARAGHARHCFVGTYGSEKRHGRIAGHAARRTRLSAIAAVLARPLPGPSPAVAGLARPIKARPAARALSTVTASTLATISSSGTGRP